MLLPRFGLKADPNYDPTEDWLDDNKGLPYMVRPYGICKRTCIWLPCQLSVVWQVQDIRARTRMPCLLSILVRTPRHGTHVA